LKLKIVIISDTHNKHKQIKSEDLPVADVIIHCGDFTSMGYSHEIRNFMNMKPEAHPIAFGVGG